MREHIINIATLLITSIFMQMCVNPCRVYLLVSKAFTKTVLFTVFLYVERKETQR